MAAQILPIDMNRKHQISVATEEQPSEPHPTLGIVPEVAPAKRLAPEHLNGIKRVQVGCGPHDLRPEWWNTDIRPFPGIDEAMDATQNWPWRNTLDFVYAEHFLEHLTFDGAAHFLCHAGNALRPGGYIRLTTPSLEWVMKTHFDPDPNNLQDVLLKTFETNRAFYGWGHQFIYSREMLFEILKLVGFENIRFCIHGQSTIPELHNLERRPSPPNSSGLPDTLVIEGQRGEAALQISPWMATWMHDTYLRWANQKH
jgi:predicted SAM-dependent methyltransferase